MSSENLKEIVKRKQFKTFWHCYEFLTTASYTPMEAFSVCIEHYGESQMFEKIAFIRSSDQGLYVVHNVYNGAPRAKWIIGVMDTKNEHLSKFYRIYQKRMMEGTVKVQPDIERTCEIIQIFDITPFISDYVREHMYKYFDIDVSKVQMLRVAEGKPNTPNDYADIRRAVVEPPSAIGVNGNGLQDFTRPDMPYQPIQPREDNIRYLNNYNDDDRNNRA
jgi:hypothetical protein